METKLIELLKLCIEKNLNYEFSPKYGLISIREFDFYSEIIFSCETWNLDNDLGIIELNQLIEKVKNYKK